MTFGPGSRVLHNGAGELGVVQDGGTAATRLVEWDTGTREYVPVRLLERSDAPRPEPVDVEEAPIIVTEPEAQAPSIILDPPVEPPPPPLEAPTPEPEPQPSAAPAGESDAAPGPATDPAPALPPKPAATKGRGGRNVIWTPELIVSRIQEWAVRHGSPPTAADWSPSLARRDGREEVAQRYESERGHWPNISTVGKVFGSWAKGLEAAGYTPRTGGVAHRQPKPKDPPAGGPHPAAAVTPDPWEALKSVVEDLQRVGIPVRITIELQVAREAA